MKLNKNEKFVLKSIVKDIEVTNKELAKSLGISTQAIGKIKRKLYAKGVIKEANLMIDFEKIGISLLAIALIKIMPKVLKKFKRSELNKILQPENVIESYAIPQTNVTHIMIYAFRNIEEYDNYFKALQTQLGEFVEIRETYVFSPKSVIKSSPKGLLLKVIEEFGKEKAMPKPELIKGSE